MSTNSPDGYINPYGADLPAAETATTPASAPSREPLPPAQAPAPGTPYGYPQPMPGQLPPPSAPYGYPPPMPGQVPPPGALQGRLQIETGQAPYPSSAPDWSGYEPQKSSTAMVVAMSIGAVALVAVLALVIYGIVGRGEPGGAPTVVPPPTQSSTTAAAPSPSGSPQTPPGQDSHWGTPFDIKFDVRRVMDIGLGDMVIAVSRKWDPATVSGINLATKEVVWTLSGKGYDDLSGDSTGLVLPTTGTGELSVVDPRTGKVTAKVTLNRTSQLLWAGNGFILTRDTYDSMCARAMSDPGKCAWTAKHGYIYTSSIDGPWESGYVFGDGKWVNTGAGVRELATGKPAGFGQDAKGSFDKAVYYIGSGSRVFRVQETEQTRVTKFQPWDVKTDKAVSGAIMARSVVADEASGVYLAYDAESDQFSGDTLSGFDWKSGDRLWTTINSSVINRHSEYIDGKWVIDANFSVTALDATTGSAVWQAARNSSLAGRLDNLIFASGFDSLVVYDATNGFLPTIEAALPSSMADVYVTRNYTFCLSREGWLWILES